MNTVNAEKHVLLSALLTINTFSSILNILVTTLNFDISLFITSLLKYILYYVLKLFHKSVLYKSIKYFSIIFSVVRILIAYYIKAFTVVWSFLC